MRKGGALIVALMVSIVLAVILSGLIFSVNVNSNEVFRSIDETKLFFEAEGAAKQMLKQLSIPANYTNNSYSVTKTVEGVDKTIKIDIVVNKTAIGFIVTCKAYRGNRSCTVTVTPTSSPLLSDVFHNIAKFGGVFRPGFMVFGSIYQTGEARITFAEKNGTIETPIFYGVVKVNMNNPYDYYKNEERDHWTFNNNNPYSGIENSTYNQYGIERDAYDPFNNPNSTLSNFQRGLLIAATAEGSGSQTADWSEAKMKGALEKTFRGDPDLNMAFNNRMDPVEPEMSFETYSDLSHKAQPITSSSSTVKQLPIYNDLGMTSGKNSRRNVELTFTGGKMKFKIMKNDGSMTMEKELEIDQGSGTKVLIVPKEYGDLYVKGEVTSDLAIVTEKDNIVISDDLYTTNYASFKDTNPNADSYKPNEDNTINSVKSKSDNQNIKLALIPAHNDTRYDAKLPSGTTYVKVNGKGNWTNQADDSFTNESFYSLEMGASGDKIFMPSKGTVKIVKNDNTDNSNSNPLLVTAAIYSRHGAMTTFKGESSYSNLVGVTDGMAPEGVYSNIEKQWYNIHDADKFFNNKVPFMLVGACLAYDMPHTYRKDIADKGLVPLLIPSKPFLDGELPPAMKAGGGSQTAKYKEGLDEFNKATIIFTNLKWEVKRD